MLDATVIQGKGSGSLLGPPRWGRSARAVEERMADAPLTRHTATHCHLQTLEGSVHQEHLLCAMPLSNSRPLSHHTGTEMGHICCDNVGATRRGSAQILGGRARECPCCPHSHVHSCAPRVLNRNSLVKGQKTFRISSKIHICAVRKQHTDAGSGATGCAGPPSQQGHCTQWPSVSPTLSPHRTPLPPGLSLAFRRLAASNSSTILHGQVRITHVIKRLHM